MPIRRVAALLLRYDYGIPARGISMERRLYVPALEQVFDEVSCFWMEDNGYPDDIYGLQTRALEFVQQEQPDLVFFVLMRDEIRPETLDKIRKISPTANWFCDDQWRFDDYSSRLAPHLDWAITTDKFSVPKYERLGGAKPILTQWASGERAVGIDFNSIDYEFDISFVGSANTTRKWYVDELSKMGVRVECFGSGWPNGRIDHRRMNEVFLRSRINLNLSNSLPADPRFVRFVVGSCVKNVLGIQQHGRRYSKRNLSEAWYDFRELFISSKRMEQVKARCFEIPAAGGFQICRYALGIEDSFQPGIEIVVYSDILELYELVEYYLNRESERKAVCLEGYRRSEEHTYVNRFSAIKKILEQDRPDGPA